MPEEMDSPVDKLSDDLHEAAREAKEHWLQWCALLAALFAVLAAVAGLESGKYANDAMLAQIKASDQWNYYQAKGIKGMLAQTEQNILQQSGKPDPDATARIAKYQIEQDDIKAAAEKLGHEAGQELDKHETLSHAVTLFQIGIAIVAISVLTRRRPFVLFAAALGLGGAWFLGQGLLMP